MCGLKKGRGSSLDHEKFVRTAVIGMSSQKADSIATLDGNVDSLVEKKSSPLVT